MAITYWGAREDLFAHLCSAETSSSSLQIIDLTIPDGPMTARTTPEWWVSSSPTVILSVRRWNTNDELGALEAQVLTYANPSIILRCSPLEINIPIYYTWGVLTGILGSSFDPSGVSWLVLKDLIAVCENLAADARAIQERHGCAYDATGPRKVPMDELAKNFSDESGHNITNHHIDPPEMVEYLRRSGMSQERATWTVQNQVAVSDVRLPETSPTLRALLKQPLEDPLSAWRRI